MGRKLKDISGQVFGRLTVMSQSERRDGKGVAFWQCRCDCGANCEVLGTRLRNGSTRSCGCLRIETRQENGRKSGPKRTGHRYSLIGEKFGRLRVVDKSPHRRNRRPAWICECDCGRHIVRTTSELTRGRSKSCGCILREWNAESKTTHGQSKNELYSVWVDVKRQCLNENFHNYRADRTVTDRWIMGSGEKTAFECFLEDVSPRRGDALLLRDGATHFCAENCEWGPRRTGVSEANVLYLFRIDTMLPNRQGRMVDGAAIYNVDGIDCHLCKIGITSESLGDKRWMTWSRRSKLPEITPLRVVAGDAAAWESKMLGGQFWTECSEWLPENVIDGRTEFRLVPVEGLRSVLCRLDALTLFSEDDAI